MTRRIDPEVRVVYARLWRYVTPHKFIGFIAVIGMAVTAVVEAGLVYLLEPLTIFDMPSMQARRVAEAPWRSWGTTALFGA